MRVAVYYNNKDIRIEERKLPEISSQEVLVRVEACGICGSDVMEWYRIHKAPLVLGHEIAGVVVKKGRGVRRVKEGDRVVVAHHVPCGICHYCKRGEFTVCNTLRTTNVDPGGFAEFIRVPEINVRHGLFKFSKKLSFEEASFAEPLACVLRAQRKCKIRKGDTVLVLGSGIAGLLHIRLARLNGAGLIVATDIDEFRLNSAKMMGADLIFRADDYSPEELAKFNNNMLADTVIICAGARSAFEQGIRSVERGGTVMFFAPLAGDDSFNLNLNKIFFKNDLTFVSSYAGAPADYAEALEMIESGRFKVRDMITHRFGLERIQEGFQLVASAGKSIKVIIEPQG
jgi:L-iditol 2-dehydrogenase